MAGEVVTEQLQNPARLRSPRVPGTPAKIAAGQRIGRIIRRRSKPGRAERLVACGKRWYVRGEMEGFVLTPWAHREKSRRRAASKVAKMSRKANR